MLMPDAYFTVTHSDCKNFTSEDLEGMTGAKAESLAVALPFLEIIRNSLQK